MGESSKPWALTLRGARIILWCLLLWAVFSGNSLAGDACRLGPDPAAFPRLFNSIEFKGSLRVLTQWKRILTRAAGQIHELNGCDPQAISCPPGGRSWKALLHQAGQHAGFEQLKVVNRYINRWPYRLDIDIYGVTDYWASPQEFLRLSGDCEDYCITKYFALRELGYPPEYLRIVIIRDQIRNLAHATLAVYLDRRIFILDNLSDGVFDQARFGHYIPQYSFNETNRWAHIPLKTPFEVPGNSERAE